MYRKIDVARNMRMNILNSKERFLLKLFSINVAKTPERYVVNISHKIIFIKDLILSNKAGARYHMTIISQGIIDEENSLGKSHISTSRKSTSSIKYSIAFVKIYDQNPSLIC
jgi:hypothetical protein